MDKISIFSFFSGCGILDLGFEKAGFNIDFVNEYSCDFLHAYKYSREQMKMAEPKYGYANIDINVFLNEKKALLKKHILSEHRLGNAVGFIGGPPCPDFSIGGKNKGKNGDKFKLFVSAYNAFRNEYDLSFESEKDSSIYDAIKKYKLASSEGINKLQNRMIRYEQLYKICLSNDETAIDSLRSVLKVLNEKHDDFLTTKVAVDAENSSEE